MAEPPSRPGIDREADTGPDRTLTTGTPRWVKVVGAVSVVVVLLVAIMLLAGGVPGDHGPGRHTGSGEDRRHTPPPGATDRHTPPPGVPDHDAPRP